MFLPPPLKNDETQELQIDIGDSFILSKKPIGSDYILQNSSFPKEFKFDFNAIDSNGDGVISKDEWDNYNAGSVDETEEPDSPEGVGSTDGVDKTQPSNSTDGDVEINIDPTEREKANRINDLTPEEKAVMDKYEKFKENCRLSEQDTTLAFFDKLSDEELANFVNAYSYINANDGGFSELFATLLFGDGAYNAITNGTSNTYMEIDRFTESANSYQVYRLIDMLPFKAKMQIIDELCPNSGKGNFRATGGQKFLEDLLFFKPEDRAEVASKMPKYISGSWFSEGFWLL